MFIPPPQKRLEFPGDGVGFCEIIKTPLNLWRLVWISSGVGVINKIPPVRGHGYFLVLHISFFQFYFLESDDNFCHWKILKIMKTFFEHCHVSSYILYFCDWEINRVQYRENFARPLYSAWLPCDQEVRIITRISFSKEKQNNCANSIQNNPDL